MKLNIGCGDKYLDGYVNVDVVESRRGVRPDIICDVTTLDKFDDSTADEILAVHLVEHFYRWEIDDILRSWVRVLKPGGTVIVECPNLSKAVYNFIVDPENESMSMWAFYGDPRWKDPLMCHKWAYTPQTLAQLLADVGLVNIRREPAQFKKRELRDMRILGDRRGESS